MEEVIFNLGIVCDSAVQNYIAINSDPFLKKRILIVQYEDVAFEPKKWAKIMLNFVYLDYV